MFAIIGCVLVILSIVGGFLMEKGNLMVLIQPAELVIIGGAAIGTLLIANPIHVLKGVVGGILGILKGSPYTKTVYLDTLKLLNDLFSYARKEGSQKFEQEIDNPADGKIFPNYPAFLKNHFALAYVCDTLRMFISTGVAPHDLEMLMESDAEVHHTEAAEPVKALSATAESLPGLGIVAAVLGVVITMGAIGGPPEEIGHKVAAALVGTFLGILLCYGFIGPLASNMTKINDAANEYYSVVRVGVIGYVKGLPPIMAVEGARRLIPVHIRPSMKEMEESIKGAKADATPQEAAA